jgi:hypothetical protein
MAGRATEAITQARAQFPVLKHRQLPLVQAFAATRAKIWTQKDGKKTNVVAFGHNSAKKYVAPDSRTT